MPSVQAQSINSFKGLELNSKMKKTCSADIHLMSLREDVRDEEQKVNVSAGRNPFMALFRKGAQKVSARDGLLFMSTNYGSSE